MGVLGGFLHYNFLSCDQGSFAVELLFLSAAPSGSSIFLLQLDDVFIAFDPVTCCGSEKTGFNPRHSQLKVSGKFPSIISWSRCPPPYRGGGGVSLVTKDVTFIAYLVIGEPNLT